jgi:transcriptional regulator with XRE-family HTH domain
MDKDISKESPLLTSMIDQWSLRMKKARLTQQKVAKEAGISVVTLSSLINFRTNKKAINPRLNTIQKVEDVFKKHGV